MNRIRIAACSPDALSMSSPNSWMVSSIRYHAVWPSLPPAAGGSVHTSTDLSTSLMIVWKMSSTWRPASAQTSCTAATALLHHTQLTARQIAEEAMSIAGKTCIYTNLNASYEELG